MVKSYLKYEPLSSFGVVASPSSNICYHNGYAICGCLNEVAVWNIRQGKLVSKWSDIAAVSSDCAEVVYIEKCPYSSDATLSTLVFAVGYADGSIRIWKCSDNETFEAELVVTLRGHTCPISKLSFAPLNINSKFKILASGSKNGDIVLWDLVSESGICRLKGHKDSITGLLFPSSCSSKLFSCSRDHLIKVWDLDLNHCIETNADMPDIGAMQFTQGDMFLIAGSSDPHIHIFRINHDQLLSTLKSKTSPILDHYAIIPRKGKERIQDILIHPAMSYFVVQCYDRFLEIFKIKTAEEMNKSLKKKKQKGKQLEIIPGEEVESIGLIRTDSKIRSISLDPIESLRILANSFDNRLYYYQYNPLESTDNYHIISQNNDGHRSDIRTIMFDHSSNHILTLSKDQLKIWNVKNGYLIRSFDIENDEFCCAVFSLNDQYIFIGTKQGHLMCLDIPSGISTCVEEAHDNNGITCIAIHPSTKNLIVTGGCDKKVRFWNILHNNGSVDMKSIHTIELADEVLLIKYSPNGKLLSIGLLDCTVQIFNISTKTSIDMTFFLSLYGHKLPVTGMDISSDNALIITASSDKNIKIWGLDYGDCHKSIFGHDEAVLSVSFIPHTHYFFSSSRDRIIKYWDSDKFQCISRLLGHFGDIWSICTSSNGSLLASTGSDKSIRIWQRTKEQIFLEDERDKEIEQVLDSTLADEYNDESDLSGAKTSHTLQSTDKLYEILELVDEEIELQSIESRNPLLSAYAGAGNEDRPVEWIFLQIVNKIPATELEQCILILPTSALFSLLRVISKCILNNNDNSILLSSRILTLLLRLHGHTMIQDSRTKAILLNIAEHGRKQLLDQRNAFGLNSVALKCLHRTWQSEHSKFMT